jgi:hypothetical protein
MALNNAGQAVVAYTPQSTIGMAAIRSASGTWGATMALPCSGAGNPAIDGAGDVVVLCGESTSTSTYTTRLPAGSSTWSTPALLTSNTIAGTTVAADSAGTFVIAWVALTTVNNTGVETVTVVTSPPGGAFGTATTFPVTLFDNIDLNIATGSATLVWNTSSGAFESTGPVS